MRVRASSGRARSAAADERAAQLRMSAQCSGGRACSAVADERAAHLRLVVRPGRPRCSFLSNGSSAVTSSGCGFAQPRCSAGCSVACGGDGCCCCCCCCCVSPLVVRSHGGWPARARSTSSSSRMTSSARRAIAVCRSSFSFCEDGRRSRDAPPKPDDASYRLYYSSKLLDFLCHVSTPKILT